MIESYYEEDELRDLSSDSEEDEEETSIETGVTSLPVDLFMNATPPQNVQ